MPKKNKKSSGDYRLKYAQQLAEDRMRGGKDPLSEEDVIERLKKIRDGALIWVEECILSANPKGTGSAESLFKFACHELEKRNVTGAARDNNWEFREFDNAFNNSENADECLN
jgi:hypothetical protein